MDNVYAKQDIMMIIKILFANNVQLFGNFIIILLNLFYHYDKFTFL